VFVNHSVTAVIPQFWFWKGKEDEARITNSQVSLLAVSVSSLELLSSRAVWMTMMPGIQEVIDSALLSMLQGRRCSILYKSIYILEFSLGRKKQARNHLSTLSQTAQNISKPSFRSRLAPATVRRWLKRFWPFQRGYRNWFSYLNGVFKYHLNLLQKQIVNLRRSNTRP